MMTGKEVRGFRLKMGLTQEKFGRRLGYKTPQIAMSRIENSKGHVSERIANALRLWSENDRMHRREERRK